jgi:hypothetical protein
VKHYFFGPLLLGVALGMAFILAACYATTGPVPSCSQDPTQDWCSPPVHDRTQPQDGGR